MEKKYEDALIALSEILLEQGRDNRVKDWEIERLQAKIAKLEQNSEKE